MTDPGPRMADVNIEDVNVAINPTTNEMVKYTNRDILGLLFPELYPFGQDFSRLEHHRKNVRSEDDINYGKYTIRTYAKYRLLHFFDRRFARNTRFITFMND
ncbi:hypothetical protein BGZ97_005445 [Linnemannia gamsii]|uniref:Uncharacterized protein n=1 Tax=Linnemannia gamsii TaxID=64522 RepID=A0A9P6QSZ0_9FUNG|nr:hypothetical protein BGZ97_005445 [Linnemannia gamsii]